MAIVKLIKNVQSSDDVLEFNNYISEVKENVSTDLVFSDRIETLVAIPFAMYTAALTDTTDGGYQQTISATQDGISVFGFDNYTYQLVYENYVSTYSGYTSSYTFDTTVAIDKSTLDRTVLNGTGQIDDAGNISSWDVTNKHREVLFWHRPFVRLPEQERLRKRRRWRRGRNNQKVNESSNRIH